MANRHTQTCAIAGALNVLGDHWTLLLVREAFYGTTRFSEFQRNTGIAKTLLSDRLAFLEEEGIFEREDVGERGTRYAYTLTEKGRALETVLVALAQWSNAHVFGKGNEPVVLVNRATGRAVPELRLRNRRGDPLAPDQLAFRAGPGASAATRKRMETIE
ncbi:MAG: helix-turn-helix domain-containing protein [Myxococcota bacterium]